MALACSTINETYSSIGVCDPTNGGIETIYLSNIQNLSAYTISAGNIITSMTMTGSSKFYEILPYTETADASNTGTKSEFGGDIFNHNIKMKMNGVSTTSVQLGYKIHRARTFAIVKTLAGKYFLYGSVSSVAPMLQKGMTSVKMDVQNGVKSEDFNGIDLELSYKTSKPAYEIDSAIIAALVTAA